MQPLDQAKRPVTLMAGPYGHPLHPALVAIPIGAWVASFIFDIASHIANHSSALNTGARWLIGIGVLGALAAASVGFLDLLAIPGGTPAHRIAIIHMSLNLAVTAAYVVNFAIRGDTSGAVGWGPLVLSLVSLGVLSVSGFLGGELAYRYGVRVAAESTQSEGFHTSKESI